MDMRKRLLFFCISLLVILSILLVSIAVLSRDGFRDEKVLAEIYGEKICWKDIEEEYYREKCLRSGKYNVRNPDVKEAIQVAVLSRHVEGLIIARMAEELTLPPFTDGEISGFREDAREQWKGMLEDWVLKNEPRISDMGAGEKRDLEYARALRTAEDYLGENGWTEEAVFEDVKDQALREKVMAAATVTVSVSPEELQQEYDRLVSQQKELCQENYPAFVAYCSLVNLEMRYAQVFGLDLACPPVCYYPVGFRRVRHVTLPLDSQPMQDYISSRVRYDEKSADELPKSYQEDPLLAEYTGNIRRMLRELALEQQTNLDRTAPCDAQQLREREHAVFMEHSGLLAQVRARISGGSFNNAVEIFGIWETGEPVDYYMILDEVAQSGYAVCSDTAVFQPEFSNLVESVMALSVPGETTDALLSPRGVHFLQYVKEIPEGAVPLSDIPADAMYGRLLRDKQTAFFREQMEKWYAESGLRYSGVIPSEAEYRASQK